MKIASGDDRIWSSQDCPDVDPDDDVVVRSAAAGRRPRGLERPPLRRECTGTLDWALPGFYHVFAAALGSTPTDVQFEVTAAPTAVVTRTAKPSRADAAASTSVAPKPPTSLAECDCPGKQSKCGGRHSRRSC